MAWGKSSFGGFTTSSKKSTKKPTTKKTSTKKATGKPANYRPTTKGRPVARVAPPAPTVRSAAQVAPVKTKTPVSFARTAGPSTPQVTPTTTRVAPTTQNRVTSRIDPGSVAARAAAAASAAKKTRLVAGPSTPQITPTMPATNRASNFVKTPAPTSRPTGYVKTGPLNNVRPPSRMNHPTESRTTSGGPRRTSTPTAPRTTTPTVTTTVTPTTTKPPATPTAPKPPTSTTPKPTPVTPGFNSLRGRSTGTVGRFNRRRLGRGPLANESLTPEELRRIAAQRVNNYG